MKSLVTSWALAAGLLAPAVLILIVVELLGVTPDVPSPALVRTRRVLLALGIVLLILVGIAIVARFHYLRK